MPRQPVATRTAWIAVSYPHDTLSDVVRLLHTSDWHLGRKLCGVSLLDDQAHMLDQVAHLCSDQSVDALIIAGDIYDRSVPPEDAVRLFSEFLARITADLGVPVVAISGNHDSRERLGFGAAIMERGGLFLRSSFARRAEPVVIDGKCGQSAHIYCLPFFDPDIARLELDDDSLRSHDAATRAALKAMHDDRDQQDAQNAVLVAHLFAQGGLETTDTERPLAIGGVAEVGVDALLGWSYVALGHLHRPQRVVSRDDIVYCGTPHNLSFSDVGQQKGVVLVDLKDGHASTKTIPLSPRRQIMRIRASFDELLLDPRFADAENAYVEATYTDTTYLLDVMTRLRARFPFLLTVLPEALVAAAGAAAQEGRDLPVRTHRDVEDLLRGFWQHVGVGELSSEHVEAFEKALAAVTAAGTLARQPQKKAA